MNQQIILEIIAQQFILPFQKADNESLIRIKIHREICGGTARASALFAIELLNDYDAVKSFFENELLYEWKRNAASL